MVVLPQNCSAGKGKILGCSCSAASNVPVCGTPGIDIEQQAAFYHVTKSSITDYIRGRLDRRVSIRSRKLKGMMAAFGGYRPSAREKFGDVAHRLGRQCEDAPFFELFPPENKSQRALVRTPVLIF